jgi:hypothetical protein
VRRRRSRLRKATGVLPDGVGVSTAEGVPPGGPLSPVLRTRVLDALEGELARRGHRLGRYADDRNLSVRSERAGQRGMASSTQCIEKRLRLTVNVAQSAVAHPEERHVLGVRLRRAPLEGHGEVRRSKRSPARLDETIRGMGARTWGGSLTAGMQQLHGDLRGGSGDFGGGTAGGETTRQGLDAHRRRRRRAGPLAHGKRTRSIAKKLMPLGRRPQRAWRSGYEGRTARWAMSHMPTGDRALRNGSWTERGLVSWAERWRTLNQNLAAPVQLPPALGEGEVVNRPAVGGITDGPEEPYVNSTCTVL